MFFKTISIGVYITVSFLLAFRSSFYVRRCKHGKQADESVEIFREGMITDNIK